MGRSAASIQAQITVTEAAILKATEAASYSVNGRSKANQRLVDLQATLDKLYTQLGRANGTSPMITRGVTLGLR